MFNKVGIAWAGKAACGFIPKMKSKFFTSQRKMFLIFVGSLSLRKGNWLMRYRYRFWVLFSIRYRSLPGSFDDIIFIIASCKIWDGIVCFIYPVKGQSYKMIIFCRSRTLNL
jgi:hypothetical protein